MQLHINWTQMVLRQDPGFILDIKCMVAYLLSQLVM